MFFNVHGNIWKIQFVNPNSKELLRSDGSSTFGVTDNSKKTIFISDNLGKYMEDKVLCHELCHVYAMEFNYIMDIETEEIVADFFSLFGRKIIYQLDDLIKLLERVA